MSKNTTESVRKQPKKPKIKKKLEKNTTVLSPGLCVMILCVKSRGFWTSNLFFGETCRLEVVFVVEFLSRRTGFIRFSPQFNHSDRSRRREIGEFQILHCSMWLCVRGCGGYFLLLRPRITRIFISFVSVRFFVFPFLCVSLLTSLSCSTATTTTTTTKHTNFTQHQHPASTEKRRKCKWLCVFSTFFKYKWNRKLVSHRWLLRSLIKIN